MRRHRVDALSLLTGSVFLVLALVFIDGNRRVTELATTWLWGLPVIALGLGAVMVGVSRLTAQANRPETEPGVDLEPDAQPRGGDRLDDG